MSQSIKLKRSAVASKIPLISDLVLGELGINTNDGKIFIKKDNGVESIVEITDNSTYLKTNVTTAPDLDDTFDLGNATHNFANIYSTNFIGTSSSAKLADLAEKYATKEDIKIGTIVTISENMDYDIEICNDKIPFGVISDKPGFILDKNLQNALPVALIGKTPVLIKGSIKKGQAFKLLENGIGEQCLFSDKYVLGRALENSSSNDIKLVKCFVKVL